jgi:hypothetical protein
MNKHTSITRAVALTAIILLSITGSMAAPKEESKVVLGMVMLNDTLMPDYNKILAELKTQHRFKIQEHDIDTLSRTLIMKLENAVILVGIITQPIPAEDLNYSLEISGFWPQAKEEVAAHRAHVVVTVLSQVDTKLDMYKMFTKVAASVLTHSNSVGIYIGSQTLVLPKMFFVDVAAHMSDKDLPLYNWIYFGIQIDNDRRSGYTYGLREFGFDEIEILNSQKTTDEVLALLFNISHYVIQNNIEIKPGDTFGITKDMRVKVSKSTGVQLEGKTLKIEY